MLDHPSLRSLETLAFRSRVDHGLFDIGLGLLWFAVTIGIATELWIGAAFGILVTLGFSGLLPWLTRSLVEARTGYVQLSPKQYARIQRSKQIASMLIIGLTLAIGLYRPDFEDGITLSVANALAAAFIGWMLSLNRFVLYAFVVGVAPWAALSSGLAVWTGWLAAALAVTVAGTWRLFVFLGQGDR